MAQKLKLHSPVGSEPLIIKWPVATSEGKEGPEEIVDTIRLVCEDFPELSTPLATRILKQGEDVSSYDYEQTKSLCDRYNKAIDSLRQLVKGSPRSKQFSKRASRSQLKHILQQCYNQSVKDPEKLNQYQPFSPGVYGETSFELVEQMIKYVKFSESDYFIDLGSGVGQVVLQVSAATDCKFCYGIEKAEWPAEYAVAMEKEFMKWMKWYGKEHGKLLLEKGDFLHDEVKEKLNKATIVFVNNFAFGPKVDHELKQRFANCLKEGTRIVSSKEFCPLNFRITERNLSDIGTIMQVEELSPLCGAVSWTGKPFAYYVHTIDRTLLEKYFQRLKNPNRKDDVEPRKDRKGRPVMSIKDKINGALSGASDSNSTASSRWRRSRNQDSHSDTASPLLSTAVKMLDFDSCSNSSQVSNSCSSVGVAGGVMGQDHDQSVVYGPTTRRQWNEYVKRPQSHSQSGTENDDSSNGDGPHDQTDKDRSKSLSQKRKKMKTVKRLNNGVLGKRQLQQKQGRKPTTKEPESPPVNPKAAFKLRPRQKQVTILVPTDKLVKASSGQAAPVAATNNHHHKPSPGQSSTSGQPPSLDSLNLLHAHTIMSTSGKESVDSVHYNDRRMTETSSAYFKPTVQKQTVSMLEKQAGFLDMIENMKQRFLSFLTFMQSPQYRAMLLLQIEQEKAKNAELKVKTENLEKDISLLQKDGLGLIKDRLKEMGIKADTPCELLSQAKDIVLSHKELQAQTASLGAQINALQAEHDQKVTMHKKALDKNMASKVLKNGVSGNFQPTTKPLGPAITSQRVKDQHQKLLLANVDRLHAELQQLQDVNRSYTRPISQAAPEENSRVRLLHSSFGDSRGTLASGKGATVNTNSFVLKEKLDMKENYDTFGEVLSTLKQEMDTSLSTQSQVALQIKPEPAVDKLNKSSSLTSLSSTNNTTGKGPSRHQATASKTGKDQKTLTYKTTAAAPVSTNLSSVTTSDRIVLVDGSIPQSSLAPASSSWIAQSKVDSVTAKSSPRILPAGMKIDIKKPCKIGANGIKSPPVNMTRGRILSAKPSAATGFTRLHESSNAIINHKTNSNPIVSPNSGEIYTDNEKSAAEDLISLKESLSCNNSVSLLLQHQQQPQLQQFQHPSVLISSSFTTSPSTSVTNSHSASFIQSPSAGGRVVTITKQQNSKTSNPFLSKTRPSQGSNSRSRHASNTSRTQPIIISESSPILYAHTLMPTSLFSGQHQETQVTPAIVDLGKQQVVSAGSKPGLSLPNSVKIVSSLQHHPSTSKSVSATSNTTKHRFLDSSVSGDEGPSSPKFRTLQPKSEGTKLSSLLAAPSLGATSFSSHSTTNDLSKPRSTVRHLLTAPSISGLSISSSQSLGISTITSTAPSSQDLIPYVTIQTPQKSLAATQGTNGAQPALLKLLQQQNSHPQPVVLAPKATPNLETSANTSSSILGSRSSLMSTLPTSVVNQAASDHKGQAVKLIPSNTLDGKGCVQCSEYGDQSVVSLASLDTKGILAADNTGASPTNECDHSLNPLVGSQAVSKTMPNHSTVELHDNKVGCSDNNKEGINESDISSPPGKDQKQTDSQDPHKSKYNVIEMQQTDFLDSKQVGPVSCSSDMPNMIEVSSEKNNSGNNQLLGSETLSKPAADDKRSLKISNKFTKLVPKPSKSYRPTEQVDNRASRSRNRDSRGAVSSLDQDLHCKKELGKVNLKTYDDCNDESKHETCAALTTCDSVKKDRLKAPEKLRSSKTREQVNLREGKRSSSSSRSSKSDRRSKSSMEKTKKSNNQHSELSGKASYSSVSAIKVERKEDGAKLRSKDRGHSASHSTDKSQQSSSSENKRSYDKAFSSSHKPLHENKKTSCKTKEEKYSASLSPVVKVESLQNLKPEKVPTQSKRDKYKSDAKNEKSTNDRKCQKNQRAPSSRSSSRSRSRSRSRHASPGPPQLERAVSPVRGKPKTKKDNSEGFLELFSVKEELLVVSEAKDSSKKTLNIYGKSSKTKRSEGSENPKDLKISSHLRGKKDCRLTHQDKKDKLDTKQALGCDKTQSSMVRSASKRTNQIKQSDKQENKTPATTDTIDCAAHKPKQEKNSKRSDTSGSRTAKDCRVSSQNHRDKNQSVENKDGKSSKRQVANKAKKEDSQANTDKKTQAISGDSDGIKDNQEEQKQDFDDANVDSPDAILTPVSMSHFNHEDEDGFASQSPKQSTSQSSQHETCHQDSTSNCSSNVPEPSSAEDPESFPFPPTPQKTPKPNSPSSCAVSTPSPCPKIPVSPSTSVSLSKCPSDHQNLDTGQGIKINQSSNSKKELTHHSTPGKDSDAIEIGDLNTGSDESSLQKDKLAEEEENLQENEQDEVSQLSASMKEDNSTTSICPQNQTPSSMCISPLFPEKTISMSKRACGRSSSTSSRCSSDDDSSSSSTNSSSSSGSSSDDDNSFRGGSKRRKRSKKHLKNSNKTNSRKTPPKKLSLLHPPLSLSIGSPPKPPLLYSPMPSPNVNGFSSYGNQGRLGLGMSSVPGILAGKSSSLAPLSISVQHSPGYQMVSADSMRSPTGVLRSPVGSGNNPSGSVMLKHYSTFPGPSSLSPTVGSSSVTLAPKLSPQVSFKKENLFDKTHDEGNRASENKNDSIVSSPNQSSFVSKVSVIESKSRTLIDATTAKDCNANNTEKSNFHITPNKDDISQETKGGLKSQVQNSEKFGEPSALLQSNQPWVQNSCPNPSTPCLEPKEPNQLSFASNILSEPQLPSLKRDPCYSQEARPVASPLLPVQSQSFRDSQALEKPSCAFANIPGAIEKKSSLHRHTRSTESYNQFQLIEQQQLSQHHHKSGHHQTRALRPARSAGCGGPPPPSQHVPAHWAYQQQHMPGLPATAPRGRSRFCGLAKQRGQTSLGYFNPGDHSRQHYNHHRGTAYPTSSASLAGAMTSGSSSPPPLLSAMDQPYGSGQWDHRFPHHSHHHNHHTPPPSNHPLFRMGAGPSSGGMGRSYHHNHHHYHHHNKYHHHNNNHHRH